MGGGLASRVESGDDDDVVVAAVALVAALAVVQLLLLLLLFLSLVPVQLLPPGGHDCRDDDMRINGTLVLRMPRKARL